MVEVTHNPATGNGHIVLTPNNSASWRFNCYIIASLLLLSSIIAGGFLLAGLWLIIPFSGLEIIAVTIGLYCCSRNNQQAEVITFSDDSVVIETGRDYPVCSQKYKRAWSKFLITKPNNPEHSKKIFLQANGEQMELGSFLNKKDRDLFIKQLRDMVYC